MLLQGNPHVLRQIHGLQAGLGVHRRTEAAGLAPPGAKDKAVCRAWLAVWAVALREVLTQVAQEVRKHC